MPSFPEIPANSCAYERYNPKSLEPVSVETTLRLQELGWNPQDFEKKTVLDIGCNSGLLAIYALRLGAARVDACDVQAPLVEFVSQVIAAHKLSATVTRRGLEDLKPETDKADIVLFMEVLHWAVSQGQKLRDVIRKLAALTNELLYIEFPWSIKEPSIQKQTSLTEELYSAGAALDELTRYFKNVRVVRFMHYFGFGSQSVRVLIEARGKLPEAEILSRLPQAYSLDCSLSRGRYESYLLSAPGGPKVAKLLTRDFPLSVLPAPLFDRLFDELIASRPRTIVMPEKIQGSYILSLPDNRSWMLFPFIGRLPAAGKRVAVSNDLGGLSDLFIAVRRDFRSVSAELLSALRDKALFTDVRPVVSPDAEWMSGPELESVKDKVSRLLQCLVGLDSKRLDSLSHGDLQTGNFVLDEKKELRVIDLDTMGLAPTYADGLSGLILRGANEAIMEAFTSKLGQEEVRPVDVVDIAFAIAKDLLWYGAAKKVNTNPFVHDQIARLLKGLTGAINFAASLPAPVIEK